MIKGLAAWVLNNYLGKYVENLNTDQLSIAISQGLVELENLPLRKDALRQYGVPIEVRAGFVGKVKLQIPVRQIWSAPWSICIEQLYLVAGPVTLSQWDQEAEERAALEYKLGVLDALEAAWRAQADNPTDTGYYASSYSAWMSYGTGLVTSIIENLQLHIKDVHVRYEDGPTSPAGGPGFACGVTVDSLTARSCDADWLPRFVASDASVGASFKEVELCSLAVYWDPLEPDGPLGGLSLGELAVSMSSSRGRSFLLAPVSARARISHDRSPRPLRSRTRPRVVCGLQLDLVTVRLADRQYGQMVRSFRGLQTLERSRRRRKRRPPLPPLEDPRAWWAYACGCPRGGSAPRTWSALLSRARDNVRYVAACSQLLASPACVLPGPTRELKDRMEAGRSLEELRALREAAMRQARPPPAPVRPQRDATGRGLLLQWFPQWWGWSKPPDAGRGGDTGGGAGAGVGDDEAGGGGAGLEDELLDALADTVENNTVLRRDAVFAQFNFSLGRGTVDLCSAAAGDGDALEGDGPPLMELQFEAMQLGLEYRPRTSSHKVTMSLGSLSLCDRLTRDTMFPNLIFPLSRDAPGQRFRRANNRPVAPDSEPLFQLAYEYRPFNSNAHYKLHVCTQSLDVVYNPEAVGWLTDFFMRPHQDLDAQLLRAAARHRYERMKQRTKQELIRNWERILQGHLSDRKTWEIELDISAPQIILVEHFCDKNAVIAVVDFGRFHFGNTPETTPPDAGSTAAARADSDDEEDDEAFMTPCSTPPASEASDEETPIMYQATSQKTDDPAGPQSFNDNTLHDKLYDRYKMELSELQVLVGRVRDNWKYAHMKPTSALHVLDRFNISLRVERRLVFTADPHFPSLTLAGNLPQLAVHINEQKAEAIRTVVAILGGRGLPSPLGNPESSPLLPGSEEADEEGEECLEPGGQELSRLLMVQFTVDQLQLEVQSRGRSIAELQVSGVKATFMKRPFDTNVSLSVHSLLLVDALQTFGPDFELLVASHKHVGMDSVSGSLRDSEPTSPTSPGSPDPGSGRSLKASPVALTQALSSLQTDSTLANRAVSPTWNLPSPPACPTSPPPYVRPPAQMELLDAEALITVEIVLVAGDCPSGGGEALQLANIQCNNLDIIANQETIVELMGFVRRVFPQLKSSSRPMPSPLHPAEREDHTSGSVSPRAAGVPTRCGRTEITFDFHRLNVLLLRGVNKEGRKIATATMAEASVKATVGMDLEVEGSLGGLQVLDLTPGGSRHQRILSLGKDPLVESILDLINADLYSMSRDPVNDKKAFSFNVRRAFATAASQDGEEADVKVRMASVWYTHSPTFLSELGSCATEFKQYLANLARSIRVAATEMAIGLVHARAEALANTFSMNARLPSSLYGSASELSTPTRRPRQYSFSQSSEMLATPNTPYSPGEERDAITNIRLDMVLDTPVVVMPRRADSREVFVAHLGRISVNNAPTTPGDEEWGVGRHETYSIEVKDMNLYSLETEDRPDSNKHPRGLLVRAEEVYSCATRGKPILHNTVVRLVVERDIGRSVMKQSDSFPTLLLGEDAGADLLHEKQDVLQVTGSVVTGLKVSLSRRQYEQLLETVDSIVSHRPSDETAPIAPRRPPPLGGIDEEGEGPSPGAGSRHPTAAAAPEDRELTVRVAFELPVFTVELRADLGSGEQGLVDLSFQDFNVQYDRSDRYETNIQMSLRSLLMEDLLRPPDSKHRRIVVSSTVRPEDRSCRGGCVYASKSCPDLAGRSYAPSHHGSLPDHLEARRVLGATRVKSSHANPIMEYPCTPPPSPHCRGSPAALHREDNLVRINVVGVDVAAPNFYTYYNGMHRSVNVDFNALDLVVNIESWVVVFDFFGVGSEEEGGGRGGGGTEQTQAAGRSVAGHERVYDSELDMEVRSLTLVLNRPRNEVARANVSQLTARLSSRGVLSELSGRLGSMSLLDLTPGCRYRERFVSSGREALNFNLVRHKTADPRLEREFDSRLKLEMSSVVYVHTQRFVAELTSFFGEFGRLRAVIRAATAAGRNVQEANERRTAHRLLLQLHAGSPVILLPLSSYSPEVLVADLGELTVSNSFCTAGSEGTNDTPRQSASFQRRGGGLHPPSAHTPDAAPACLLDVMQIELVNVDLYAGRKVTPATEGNARPTLEVGDLCVNKEGPSLLQDKCQLKLQVDRNLDTHLARQVPDMSVRGTLSTLNGALDLRQYKLIRGLLSYNIGENLDQFYPSAAATAAAQGGVSSESQQQPGAGGWGGGGGSVWTTTRVLLDLKDVAVRLQLGHATADRPDASLACINFIKSRLLVEAFSDRSQDVDLVSQEILITDTRFQAHPVNKRSNVFQNILKPIRPLGKGEGPRDIVQVEIHHRRRRDYSKFTILLDNMRLMAVLDWWETVVHFILENADDPTVPCALPAAPCDPTDAAAAIAASVGIVTKYTPSLAPALVAPFELKLNITDSQVVLVEDTSQWDTNALILKSTTVISYRPRMADKPLSCNLNHLELFSCVLPNEEETALSIIDPVTINLEVTRRPGRTSGGLVDATLSPSEDRVLEVQMPQLNVRLSYHDFLMFAAILRSLPNQTSWARSQDTTRQQPANVHSHISKLSALGFAPTDCSIALDRCNGHLDDAALWLTSHASPVDVSGRRESGERDSESALSFHAVELKTSTLCVSIIDDCGDADVPLLELSLSQMSFTQELDGPGQLRGVLSCDYLNRVLSGWEPLLEPWRCQARWEHCLGGSLARNRLHVSVSADEVMNINLTNTLMEQYDGVKRSWMKDYYSDQREEEGGALCQEVGGSPAGHRRRAPFVPYELSNETGSWLRYTLSTLSENRSESEEEPGEIPELEGTWVRPGETTDLPLQTRGKVRHSDSHKPRVHQLRVKVNGWRTLRPISIDKVGIYFCQAKSELQTSRVEVPEGRVVLEVKRLKESAKKQVVVRSSLLLENRLADPIEIKLDHSIANKGGSRSEVAKIAESEKNLVVASGATLPVPLSHVIFPLFVRPLVPWPCSAGLRYTFCTRMLNWTHVVQPGSVSEEVMQCNSNSDFNYRFLVSVHRDNYPVEQLLAQSWVQPAHTISLLAPLSLENTLPVDLQYSVGGLSNVVKPGAGQPFHHVDVERPFEVTLTLENYPVPATLHVPHPCNNFSARLRVSDPLGRRLNLLAHVRTDPGRGLVVTVCVPYWIINKTELPLVFRQEGDPSEAAGQFDEHEMARMVAPLLFSFADPGASSSVVARIGRSYKGEGTPQWCQQFHLQPGVQIRRLHVNMRNNRPDFVYVIGVEVRTGRGRYRTTNIVNLTPRYQLYNRTKYNIQFAQKCFALTITDPLAEMTYLQAVPDCSLPFHWPRLDKDALLCLRLTDMPCTSLWSGGFGLDSDASFHVNVRDPTGRGHFILVEVALARATYHIVLTDARELPAPLRVDNFSEVPLTYYQSCVSEDRLHGVVRPHSTVPYAWDEPIRPPHLTLVAPGGAQAAYNMCRPGEQAHLTYENFIYIALTGTFNSSGTVDPLEVSSQQLVLSVPEGSRVVLARKQQGARAQLWRMTSEGLLQHEGSSPPSERGKRSANPLVLDIQGPAPQPLQYSALVLHRPDKRRKTTQTWRFTEDGRLCCAHNNMCVQAKDGFFGLRAGSEAVLGPPQAVCHQMTDSGIPLEQAVGSQKMRPGSGYLMVQVKNDGPTRVLEVRDVGTKRLYATADDRDWSNICAVQRPHLLHQEAAKAGVQDTRELEVSVELPAGVGLSVISRGEELVYCRLAGINLHSVQTSAKLRLELTVRDVQCDNQQLEAQCPTVVYVSPSTPRYEDPSPALYADLERQRPRPGDNAEVYDHLIVKVKNLSLTIEERLLLKLFVFAGWKESDNEQEDVNEIEFETQRLLSEALSLKAKRYHFGTLQLQPSQVRLSVMTSGKMPGQLRAIKRRLGMRLIKFEDASVELQPFIKNNCYETRQFILMSILKHFKEELRWQAATILGSVDFLGNPLGFMLDVSEGVTGLIRDGNVVTLVKNVTHGLSNSAAKVTESLSDGLGRVILDDSHEETRLRIRTGQTASSGDHLLAGLKGLGLGLLGGVTSVFKQSYEGAAAEGVPGFIAGFGKGLVGTVTKPVVGMLDLASEAASAVRDSSRSSSRAVPGRIRPSRCVTGPGGLLLRYSKKQAQGQEFLYQLNNHNYSEVFVCYEVMRSGTEDFRIVISSDKLRIFSCAGGGVSPPVIETSLGHLYSCKPTSVHVSLHGEENHYVELAMRADENEQMRKPKVRCDSATVASEVAHLINYARRKYEERKYTLEPAGDTAADD